MSTSSRDLPTERLAGCATGGGIQAKGWPLRRMDLWRPCHQARQLLALCLALLFAVTSAPSQAGLLTVGARLTAVPTGLEDPLSSLSLNASEFLVPVLAQSANLLEEWQFSLRFDTSVARPVDGAGLYVSVYQSDFGGGSVSQITGSGFLLDGLLQDVSGYFSPPVTGDGVIAYVLFEYLKGHEGLDPGVQVGDDPTMPPQSVPEPSAWSVLALTAVIGALHTRRRQTPVLFNESHQRPHP